MDTVHLYRTIHYTMDIYYQTNMFISIVCFHLVWVIYPSITIAARYCQKNGGGWIGFGVLVPLGSTRPSAWSHRRMKPRPSEDTLLSTRVGTQPSSLVQEPLKMLLRMIGARICQTVCAIGPEGKKIITSDP